MNVDVMILREKINKLVPLLAGQKVQVTQRGSMAYVEADKNGKPKRVNIPFLPDNAGKDLVVATEGFIDHEIGHVLHTDFGVYTKAGAVSKKVKVMTNIIEDPWVEKMMQAKFPGSVSNIHDTQKFMLEKYTKPALAKAVNQQQITGILIVPAVRAWAGQKVFADYMADKWHLLGKMPDQIKDLIPRIAQIKSTQDSLALANDIVTRLKDLATPPPPQPEPQDNEEQDEEQSDSQDSQSGDGEGESDQSDKQEPKDADESEGDGGDSSEDKDGESDKDDAGSDAADDNDKGNEDKSEGDSDAEDKGEADGKDSDAEDDAGDESEGDEAEGDGDSDADEGEEDDAGSQGSGEDDDGEEDTSGADQDATEDEGADGDSDADSDPADDDGAEGDGDGSDDGSDADGEDDDQQEGNEGSGDAEGDGDGSDAGDDDDWDDSNSPFGAAEEDDGDDLADDDAGDATDGDEADESDAEGSDDKGDAGQGKPKGTNRQPKTSELPTEEQQSAEDALEGIEEAKDFDDAVSEAIGEAATESMSSAPYKLFTKDWDRIEVMPVENASEAQAVVNQMDDEMRPILGVMQKNLERFIASQSRTQNIPGKRSGRLNAGALARLPMGDDRVFRHRTMHRSKETAVSLLMDNSGSMAGQKVRLAMAAGLALGSVLERIHVKFEALGFTTLYATESQEEDIRREQAKGNQYTRYEPLNIPIYKGFNERLTPEVRQRWAEPVVEENRSYTRSSSMAYKKALLRNNVDGESVEIAAWRLQQRPEQRKILIVLSDGMPNAFSNDHAALHEHLKRAIAQAEQRKVEVFGIGIMSDAVEQFYRRHAVIKNVAELPAILMGQVSQMLRA